MKTSILVILVLLVAVAGFANPFLGQWETNIGRDSGDRIVFFINDDSILGCRYSGMAVMYTLVGSYTLENDIIRINDTPWLYYVGDVNHIGLIAWVSQDGEIGPMLLLLIRVEEEKKES
jgi:hypothetical protein